MDRTVLEHLKRASDFEEMSLSVYEKEQDKAECFTEEFLKMAFEFGKYGLIFPSKMTRGDMVEILHMVYTLEIDETTRSEVASGDEQITDKELCYLIGRIAYEKTFELHEGKHYNNLKCDVLSKLTNSESDHLKMEQTFQAFEMGLFFPCACALTAMVEGIMGKIVRSAETRLYCLMNDVSEKTNHAEKEIIGANLKGFISQLAKNSNFVSGDEPVMINRHWLLHGRSKNPIKKVDCLSLFATYKELLELSENANSTAQDK